MSSTFRGSARAPGFRADRAMMLALNGRPSEVDVFAFHLAKELGCFVADLERMPHSEYVQWAGFFKAKHAVENQKGVQ